MRFHACWIALAAVTVFLQGCGGGGGEGPATPPATYSVGGAVSGLAGSGLVLQLNGTTELAIGVNGNFTFPGTLASNSSYAVSVKTQPTTPYQTCAVTSGSGTVNAAAANISVACTTNTYSVSGSVGGLAGSGLVLALNGSVEMPIGSNGSFSFPGALTSGSAYAVTVKTQPATPSQTCVAASSAGNVSNSAVTDVSVTCTTNTYAVGGTVGGLAGSGLVLQLNGARDLAVGANGTYSFAGGLASGSTYAVTVRTQPANPSQTCVATSPTGVVTGSAIGVSVACTTSSFAVSASVTGLSGTGLVLQLNGGPNLAIPSNGAFMFPGPVSSGSPYAVTIKTQPFGPSQTCVVTNPSGVIGAAAVSVSLNCTTNSYSVGGSITGLTGPGLVLQLNGGQDLPINSDGSFEFPTVLLSGSTYTVSVKSQTTTYRELCKASRATGNVGSSDVNSVTVNCAVVGGFVYVVNHVAATNSDHIFEYGFHPQTGALLSMGAAAAVSTNVQNLVVTPNGATLYASDRLTKKILSFSVDSSKGTLTATGTPITDADPRVLAVHPSGKFLYVGNASPTAGVTRYSIDSVTGELSAPSSVATAPFSGSSASLDLAITPDGAFLYALSQDGNTQSSATVFSIDSTTGALTAGATITPTVNGRVTIDTLGRFLYLLKQTAFVTSSTTLYPYSLDPGTGTPTPVNVNTTVDSSGSRMLVEPTGQYAYLLGNFNANAADNHIDSFAIDPATGALTTIGTPTLVQGWPTAFATDAAGKFIFAASVLSPGTFDPDAAWYDGSTFAISTTGPTAGRVSAVGPNAGLAASTFTIAVVQ